MKKTRLLVTVKTAPLLSTKYTETVCTAGILPDGSWIRIYPIAYRLLDKRQKFKKYQWIEASLEKDTSDPRPESYKLTGKIRLLHHLDTKNGWKHRKDAVLKNVYTNLTGLIHKARDKNISTSLAIFKPTRVIDFKVERIATKQAFLDRKKLLAEAKSDMRAFKLAQYVPFTFYYVFADDAGRRSCLQILDWEIYELCRKLMRQYGACKRALEKHLRRKYFDEMIHGRDVYFYLGTTKYWHIRRSRNPFVIVGVFYPPKEA